jgi:hypothetical protein
MLHAQQDTSSITATTSTGGGALLTMPAADVATRNAADKRFDAVRMVGYLEAGSSEDHRRLYRSPASELYIELLARDIVDTSPAAANGDPSDERSMIWVHRDAGVVWRELMPASSFDQSDLDEIVSWPRG